MSNGLLYNAEYDWLKREVSLLDKDGNVLKKFSPPVKDSIIRPLTLISRQNSSTVKLIANGTVTNEYAYLLDASSEWLPYTLGTAIPLDEGEAVAFKITKLNHTQSSSNYVLFELLGSIEAWNNVQSMAIVGDFAQSDRVPSYGLRNLFFNCSALIKAPLLPATSLNQYCYVSMFEGCTSLTQAPVLPATSTPFYGYRSMFKGCTSLTQAPVLPATSLGQYCYMYMFGGCTSLTQAPALPATNLNQYCYQYMFNGCTSLTKAPDLPATVLKKASYYSMFYQCSNLNEVHISANDISVSNCLDYWLYQVSPTGDIYCNPNLSFPSNSFGIPTGWNRWVLGATDTGTTATMYHNGSTETVMVGTSDYGTCYALQGWAGFKSLAEMHALGYTLQAPIQTTMYHNGTSESIVMFAGNGSDGFAEDVYFLNGEYNTLSQMHTLGYTFGAQTTLTMYDDNGHPVSAYSCDANQNDGFTETMYDVGDGNGYLTEAQQEANGYTVTNRAPLTLTATANNSSVTLNKVGTLGNTFEVDTGSGWQSYTLGTVINLNSGDSCKWRCSAHPTTQSTSDYIQFLMSGTIEAWGNVNSMLSSEFKNMTSLVGYDYAFKSLFKGCTSLIKAPEMPATTLSNDCYSNMFNGCTALTEAPDLPATTLSSYCYNAIFYGCTALTKTSELPATTLSSYCYQYMFSGCTALIKTPKLPAPTLPSYCYQKMFQGCTSLNEVRVAAFLKDPGAQGYLTNWLNGVSATGNFYCNQIATIFPTDSVDGIPTGWTRRNINDYPTT